jgi:LytS/YehU family sensor histidine kinase
LLEVDKACRSLADELEYVNLYLSLEKMRFRDKFHYSFEISEQTDLSILIPNMVLHTYCENAIKHGLKNKKTCGNLIIKAVPVRKGIMLSVKDNGIGRKEAARQKTGGTGKGLDILMQQIEIYNQLNKEKIVQHITDLKNENGIAEGTIFELYIPYGYRYI